MITITRNREKKAKSVGCKIEDMRSRLCFLYPGIPGMPVNARGNRSKNFNIELREVTFGIHLRKHLRLLVGYCETSVTGSHARLDHNMNSETTWSLETSIPQDFSVIVILQSEKYIYN